MTERKLRSFSASRSPREMARLDERDRKKKEVDEFNAKRRPLLDKLYALESDLELALDELKNARDSATMERSDRRELEAEQRRARKAAKLVAHIRAKIIEQQKLIERV